VSHRNHDHPNPEDFLANLRKPMPLWRKVWLFVRNNGKKIITLKSCCGHPGEPGC
jgi:hypothetical protein